MAAILGVGIATIDIINTLSAYPAENSEVRALMQTRTRGGNATNTLSVLTQLGHQCQWLGCLTGDPDGDFIRSELDASGVGYQYCKIHHQGAMPTSYIALNQHNGSRTIVHYRDLPELSLSDCTELPWPAFSWIHLEGRNVEQTRLLLKQLRDNSYPGKLSIEIEKPRDNISALYEYADLLIFSRHFVETSGISDPVRFLHQTRAATGDRADLVCAWGESGAYGLDTLNNLHQSPAFPPPRVIDTLGAGDVFNAGLIHACLRHSPLSSALESACRLAGKKCGQLGLRNLMAP